MVAKRLAALIAAVALVVGAFALRRSLDDSSSAAPAAPTSSDPTSATQPAAGVSIVCVTELAAACDAARAKGADATAEPYADTLSRIAGGDVPTAWITLAPLDRMALDDANQRVYADATTQLASSPLVIVAASDRATALAAACGGTISWKCIGANSATAWSNLGGQGSWGRLLAGHADPTRSATGLLTLGTSAASFFGDTAFIQSDINGNVDFGLWFQQLEKAIPSGVFPLASPLDAILGRKLVSVVGTTEADVAERAGDQRSALTVTPSGATAIAVVVLRPGVSLADNTVAALRAGLTSGGWSDLPVDPPASGLPSSGALRTLRDNWSNLK